MVAGAAAGDGDDNVGAAVVSFISSTYIFRNLGSASQTATSSKLRTRVMASSWRRACRPAPMTQSFLTFCRARYLTEMAPAAPVRQPVIQVPSRMQTRALVSASKSMTVFMPMGRPFSGFLS